MQPADLERAVDRALKRLPAPRAPHTLLPRVLRSVQHLAARSRSWFDWPLAWRVVSMAAVVLLIAGAVQAWPLVRPWIETRVSVPAEGAAERIASAARGAAAVAGAIGSVWRTWLQPVASSFLVFVALMAAACALGAAALGHVAFGETSRP